MKNSEQRAFTGTLEVRQREDGSSVIRGMAAVYDKLSANLGGFREIIAPGAFEETDMSDVRGLFNHDSNFVLGRNRSNTLRLERASDGLGYEIDVPDTQTIRDLVLAPIQRGDVSQSSFGFIVGRGNDEWDENDEGVLIRTIKKVRELFDVSPVTFPAYPDTSVGERSMAEWKEARERHEHQLAEEARERLARNKTLESLDRRVILPGA